MFWKHFTPPVSELDNLLAKDDCTLTEVLDAEDVLQECKGINNKLLKFLTRDDNMEELVSLVTLEPLDDVDEAERFKHPNTACNILTSGAGTIVDKLIAEEPLMDKLFEFMESEPPLNSLLASFFSRVVIELFSKKASLMLTYISSKTGLVDSFLSHIDTSAIMDLLMGIVSAFQMPEERQEICKWLEEHGIVEKLVDLISGDVGAEKQRNAARTLTELHRHGYEFLSMNYDSITQDDLLEVLESNAVVERLLRNMLASRNVTGPFCHGPEFLCSMLNLQQMGTQTNGIIADHIQYPNVTNEDAARRVSECVVPFLPQLIDVLRSPPSSQPILTSAGHIQVPLGPARLAIIRLLTSLTQVGCVEYDRELAQLNLASILLELFAQFEWNSFLHTYVDQFIGFVLGSSSEAATDLIRSLILDARLLQRFAQIAMENENEQMSSSGNGGGSDGERGTGDNENASNDSGNGGGDTQQQRGQQQRRRRRRGYMGHVVNISNAVLHSLDASEELRNAVERVDTDDLDEWRQWVDGPLETVNKKNNSVLGGTIPSLMSIEDSDEDIPIDTPQQQPPQIADAFSFYQTQQMAADFADSFGFEDEDFSGDFEQSENAPFQHGTNVDFETPADADANSSSLFEQACSERLQRYSDSDDGDSDGDDTNTAAGRAHGFGQDDWIEKEPTVQTAAGFGGDIVDSDSSTESGDSGANPTRRRADDSSGDEDDDEDDEDDDDEEEDAKQAPFVILSRQVPLSRLSKTASGGGAASGNAAAAAASVGGGAPSGDVNNLFMDVTQTHSWTANFDAMDVDTSSSSLASSGDATNTAGDATAVVNSSAGTATSATPLTGWASFGAFDGRETATSGEASNSGNDEAPLVAASGNATIVQALPDGGSSSSTPAVDNNDEHSSSSCEVSSTDDSDDSDERDGSYSFSHMSSGSDGESTPTTLPADDGRGEDDSEQATVQPVTALSPATAPSSIASQDGDDNSDSRGEAMDIDTDSAAPPAESAPVEVSSSD
eukprot:scpid27047/ scgid11254/ Serine/threonine-protein phosphatase 6 regulatory subunit 2; SAPS domain family member 2